MASSSGLNSLKCVKPTDNRTEEPNGTENSTKYSEVDRCRNNDKSAWHYFLRACDGQSAKCKEISCQSIIKSTGGTTSGLHAHLKSKHGIDLLKRNSHPTLKADCNLSSKYPRQNKNNLSEVLARMTAKDGIPFGVFATSQDLRRALLADRYSDLPKSAHTIKKMVVDFSKDLREKQKIIISQLSYNGQKFSCTFDEWTSNKNRRYMNIVLHGKSPSFWNLGLIRMRGSMPADKCLNLVERKLEDYGLCLKRDIVSIITDGTSVMTKIGKMAVCKQQLCYAHGIQLAVIDVLYKKKSTSSSSDLDTNVFDEDLRLENLDDSDSDSSTTEELDTLEYATENSITEVRDKFKPLIDKIRLIVKLFKRSPLKNEKLQSYVVADLKKEAALLLDSKTRWSSLAAMLDRFLSIKNCIKKALVDVHPDLTIEEWEMESVQDILECLKPIQACVEALCRRDANLITADAAIKFTLKRLKLQNSLLSRELQEALVVRISQRRTDFASVLQYLHSGKFASQEEDEENEDHEELFCIPTTQKIAAIIKELIDRLNSTPESDVNCRSPKSNEDGHNPNEFEKNKNNKTELSIELDKAIRKALLSTHVEKIQQKKSLITNIRQEMKFFEGGGKRGDNLSQAYEYLLGILPTSVESERAFSSSGYLCNKLRCSFNDDTLDHLCFLRSHFQQLNAFQNK